MAGFFGLSYSDYVDIELIIDITGYNNSLAGYNVCPVNRHRYSILSYISR